MCQLYILAVKVKMSCNTKRVIDWSCESVAEWLEEKGHSKYIELLCSIHEIDGRALLLLTEHDLRTPPLNIQVRLIRVWLIA